MTMEKYMRLKVIRNDGAPNDFSLVDFMIEEQSHRGCFFGREGSPSFYASNGVRLSSSDCPEWRERIKTLFVKGDRRHKDDEIITCTAKEYDLIYDAVTEYNKTFMEFETTFDKELFEI